MSRDHAREVDAEFVLGTARHRLRLIVAFTVLGLIGGVLLALSQPPMVTATTQVYVYPLEGNPYAPTGSQDDEVSLETESQIVGSDPVVTQVAQDTGLDPSLIRRRLTVSVPVNTQLLDISFAAPQESVALKTDQALATTYLQLRRERAEALYARRVGNVDDRIDQINKQLQQLSTLSSTEQASPVNQALRRALSAELVNLRAQRVDLVTGRTEPGRVTSEAMPSGGSRLVQGALVAAGLLVGLVLGLSLALAVERRRGRVWGAGDVRAAGLPVLLDLGRRRGKAQGFAALDVEVRRLRASILDATPHRSLVSVSGYASDAGVGDLTSALAASIARAGMTVLVVDAQSAPTGTTPGLTQVLLGEVDAASVVTETDVPGVWSLPRGHEAGEVADYFVREHISARLRPVARQYDYTIVRAPGLESPEGEAVGQAADVVVLVLGTGTVLQDDLAGVTERATVTDTRLLGVVLVRDVARWSQTAPPSASPPSGPQRVSTTTGDSDSDPDRSRSAVRS